MSARTVSMAFLLASTAFVVPAAHSIVNGTLSSEWPAAGVFYNGNDINPLYCSAFAVSPRWIATAGHCLDSNGYTASAAFITGADPFAPAAVYYTIDSVIFHPSYSKVTYDYDLAIAHLVQDQPFLPFKLNSMALSSGDVGRHVNLLANGYPSPSTVEFLKRSGVTTITAVNTASIEAGYSPSGPCFGDDGSAMFVHDTDGFPLALGVLGLLGDLDCSTTYKSVRVDAALSFIQAHVADACLDGQSCIGIFRTTFELTP